MRGLRDRLLAHALSFPQAWEDFPWEDDLVVKVRKKVFVFFGTGHGESPGIGIKLVASLDEASNFEGVQPSGYGLGKWGWVTVPLTGPIPPELIFDWLEESYRTVAPKTLVQQLDCGQ